ncbi:hypothetical protein Tsp_03511, partial [Trichinella spiralis]
MYPIPHLRLLKRKTTGKLLTLPTHNNV